MDPPTTVVCITCGAVNPAGVRFCGSCGRAMEPPRVGPAPACRRCGSPNLKFFANGKGVCVYCKHIFPWGRTYDGGIAILESL